MAERWLEQGVGAAAIATATKAANARKPYTVRGISASYNIAADEGLVQVKRDAAVIASFFVHAGQQLSIPLTVSILPGEAVSIELAADTGSGLVNIWGDDLTTNPPAGI